jgi:putative hydrolase of the HAD superfamily
MFEDIFDIVAADFVPKPEAATYDRFFDKHAIDPQHACMFEDLAQNLIVPHARGMKTVLVMPKPGLMDYREACEITSEVIPAHIDFATTNLEAFLEKMVVNNV